VHNNYLGILFASRIHHFLDSNSCKEEDPSLSVNEYRSQAEQKVAPASEKKYFRYGRHSLLSSLEFANFPAAQEMQKHESFLPSEEPFRQGKQEE
jgi:hypothetical protein